MWAQETYPEVYYYYVEEKEAGDLEPLSKTRDRESQVLTLTFENNEFNSFINNQTVYVFKKAFPGALTERLQRMYYVGVTSDTLVNSFYAFEDIPYADFLGTQDFEELSIPDDYISNANIPTQGVTSQGSTISLPASSYAHLDLVNAKQAWNLSTGNPNIAIGIRDSRINPNHPDLVNKISQHYGSIPSNPGSSTTWHGTKVAGCAAADTDNGIGIASIGYNTSMVTSNGGSSNTSTDPNFPNAGPLPMSLLYIVQNHPNVKVITHSKLESCNYIQANALVYKEIWEQYGVTVITAGGNGNWKNYCPDANGGHQGYAYPASYDHVISVGTVGHNNPYGYTDSNGNAWGWKDVHEFVIGDDYYTFTHNDKIDIVAPGYGIPSTNLDNKYATGFGTSYSGPFVCGIAALMYDVNPNITPDQVKQILMDTAVDIYQIPENQPYIDMLGAGRVNAYAAVLQAKCLANPTAGLDLMMQNSDDDFGIEPDTVTNPIWNSPDIWVRNQPDGHLVQEHQDLHYVSNQTPVYVYVKVTNNSCETSLGTEELKLYWAKGGVSQTWPVVWSTGATQNNLPIGNDVGAQNIPVLAPGESTILEFEWQPHNPDDYENNGNFTKPWMFCFLARIEAPNDPMTFTEVTNVSTNTRNNNNIAYKNTTVLNVSGGPKGTITAGNYFSETPTVVDFNFFTVGANNTNIWKQAEISIELDETIWDNWLRNSGEGRNYEIVNKEKHRILLTGNHAQLTNVPFGSDEGGLITLEVNFLTDEVDSQDNFELHIEQYDVSRDESKGGFTFNVRRDVSRPDFEAEGERERINNTTTLKAISINENAIYNWYDEQGELVHMGVQLTVTDPIAQEYKLEIIADSDGHKDYTSVNSESPYKLESLSPNPANDQVLVTYEAQGAVSGYISITSIQTAVSNNYILNVNNPDLNVDVSTYTPGIYVVALSCDGEIIETKNLIIQ
ncbi:S8 family serine peptidase [Mesonia aestuariivivens]|uniref:S8 family peptidase n=1 Tax=Mesonia aestuariivivens TaxID=2796128 RepID=A0ABS6VZU6_9FLAO|nr:S8 family serine peptidase [Mesonia aestuariivivens]MBW2960827.1 S8 family peptidase [Mesonia aestuariivivens]